MPDSCDRWTLQTYGGEAERVDLDTECRNVLLLKLSSQMALDEGGLHGDAVSLCSRCRLIELPGAVRHGAFAVECDRLQRTFPVPPSPTSTSLKVGMLPLASAMAAVCCGGVCV